jgi:hypothetical protein
MDSLKRGFAFLKQSWQMAMADKDLIKPSIYALFAGFFVTLIGLIPIGLAQFFLGKFAIGQVIVYIMSALLIFTQYTVTYVFSAMTIYLIYGYLAEGDGKMGKAWEIVRRDFLDILSLAAASTIVNLVLGFVRGRNTGGVRRALAGLINAIWTEATFLVLPAMVIEDISLKAGLKRATQIVRSNLLLVGISTVGVRVITNFISFLLGGLGIALGLGVGLGIVSLFSASVFGLVAGVSLGILIATPFILVATVIATYTATAYHTCLYLWARDVEHARLTGQPTEIAAPAPLASVLSQ